MVLVLMPSFSIVAVARDQVPCYSGQQQNCILMVASYGLAAADYHCDNTLAFPLCELQ